MSKQRYSKEEVEQARTRLLELLKPGDKVYCILRHVSRSGMLWRISPVIIRDCRTIHLDFPVAAVLDWPSEGAEKGIKVYGCGMDMGFHLVYELSRILFPDGFGEACQEPGCTYRPKTKQEASESLRLAGHGVTPHIFWGRNGDLSGWDNDGGYALKHEWI